MFISGADCLLVKASVLAGDMPAALKYARGLHAEQAEFDMPSAVCYTNYCLSIAHYFLGDLGAALAHSDLEIASARSINLPRALAHALLFRAFLLAEQGRFSEANTYVAEAVSYPLRDLDWALELARTAIAVNSGAAEQAPPLTRWDLVDEGHSRSMRIFYRGYAAMAGGDHDEAASIIGHMRELGSTAPFLDALADHLDGLLAGKAELLRIAADRLDAMGSPVLAAQAYLHWAELVGDGARDEVARCLEVFAAAGTIPWLDRTRRLARTLGIRAPAPRTPGLLSNRESQIVGLVGTGLSNADIAARLFLSERTVETHLRNSYAKLGLGSRVALAQWATQELAARL